MSYIDQAEKMNIRLKDLLTFHPNKEEVINTILWFGQVAKFRCRSNSAYDNYSQLVFKDIVQIQRIPDPLNPEWEKLQVTQ